MCRAGFGRGELQRALGCPDVRRAGLHRNQYDVGAAHGESRVGRDLRRRVDQHDIVTAPQPVQFGGKPPAGDVVKADGGGALDPGLAQLVPAGEALLRIDVEHSDASGRRQRRRQVGNKRRLSGAAFLLRDRDHNGHGHATPLRFRSR